MLGSCCATPSALGPAPPTRWNTIATIMRDHHIHRVFVSDNRKVVGVVSTTSILNGLIDSCSC